MLPIWPVASRNSRGPAVNVKSVVDVTQTEYTHFSVAEYIIIFGKQTMFNVCWLLFIWNKAC